MAITFPTPTQLKNGAAASDPGDFVTKGQADALYGGVRLDVPAASASWILTHGLGRVPIVAVYLANGEQVIANVFATSTTITVAFADAQTGFVIAA